MPIVMDADRIGRTLTRIAHEIDERNKGVQDLALVGVRRRGEHIAKRLAAILKDITGHEIPTGALSRKPGPSTFSSTPTISGSIACGSNVRVLANNA